MLLKVVIVEDEDIIRRGLVHNLKWQELGCVVTGAAKDGVEGLEVIRRVQPDLVLTDIKMPRMGGLEMLRQALQERKLYSIVLTSYAEFDLAKTALQMGVKEYLLKPVDVRELREALDRIRADMDNHPEQTVTLGEEEQLPAVEAFRKLWTEPESLEPYTRKTCRIVCHRYQDRIGINDVADELGVSPSYLSRKLKNQLGITFVDLINQYRVLQAVKLLRQEELRIYEISDELGFSDYKHFNGVFKKYMGMSPSEFAKIKENK